jgi:hypothetical protein
MFFTAEDAENAENCKDGGTANNVLYGPLAEIALPLLLDPSSAASAISLAGLRPPWLGRHAGA